MELLPGFATALGCGIQKSRVIFLHNYNFHHFFPKWATILTVSFFPHVTSKMRTTAPVSGSAGIRI